MDTLACIEFPWMALALSFLSPSSYSTCYLFFGFDVSGFAFLPTIFPSLWRACDCVNLRFFRKRTLHIKQHIVAVATSSTFSLHQEYSTVLSTLLKLHSSANDKTMAFLKKIDSHDRQMEELHIEMDKLKAQIPELRVLVRTLQATCEEMKENEEKARKSRRLSARIPRMLQGLKGRARKRESFLESSRSGRASGSGSGRESGSGGSGRSDGSAGVRRSSDEDVDDEGVDDERK